MQNDVLTILFETARDDEYVVYSENDGTTYKMKRSDLEYEARTQDAEIVGEY